MGLVGFAASVLGFFMLGWKEPRGWKTGGPYVIFGLCFFLFARHIAPVSRGWSWLIYAAGVFSILFGLAVLAQENRSKSWFVARYFLLGVFWLVMSVVVPEVTSSMRIFPVLIGLGYVAIALAASNARQLTGGHVGFDVAFNGICFLFLGILLASVPDFFNNPGPSIWTP